MKTIARCLVLAVSAVLLAAGVASAGDEGMITCEMKFTLKGWSVFFKTADGQGKVTCSNGKTAEVKIKVRGGGLTFGKSEIRDGFGKFSHLTGIEEIFGGYVAAEAHAGAVKSTQASVYTKGEVSLALVGTGRGVNIGFDFGKLTIYKPGEKEDDD
jgi:hypothetical protein